MDLNKTQIIKDLIERDSLQSIEGACRGITANSIQIVSTIRALLIKKCIISLDTGMGKTVIAMMLINLIAKENDLSLFVVKRGTLDEIYKKDKKMLKSNLNIGYITNEQHVIERMITRRLVSKSNLIVISSDCISNALVNNYLFENRDRFKVVVIDEMHLFSNLESVESRLMAYLAKKSEYSFTLTATQLQRDIDQVINTAYMLNENIFDGKKPRAVYNLFVIYSQGKIVGYKNLDILRKILLPITINITRQMAGVKYKKICKIEKIKSLPEWRDLRGLEAFRVIKGNTKQQPFYKLVELIEVYTSLGKKGLIYANLNDIKRPILERLRQLGYRVGIHDGTIAKKSEKAYTRESFREGNLDVLIINTPTSLDLESDYVIFYEMTLAYSQVIGRACRSYEDKTVFIHFIIAEGTYEEKFFMENVYKKAKLLSEVCDKDTSELEIALEEYKNE